MVRHIHVCVAEVLLLYINVCGIHVEYVMKMYSFYVQVSIRSVTQLSQEISREKSSDTAIAGPTCRSQYSGSARMVHVYVYRSCKSSTSLQVHHICYRPQSVSV